MNDYQPTSNLRIIRAAATRIGCGAEEYRDRRAAGEKWCGGCRAWHPRADFAANRSSSDGLATICRVSKSAYDADYYRDRRKLRQPYPGNAARWRTTAARHERRGSGG